MAWAYRSFSVVMEVKPSDMPGRTEEVPVERAVCETIHFLHWVWRTQMINVLFLLTRLS